MADEHRITIISDYSNAGVTSYVSKSLTLDAGGTVNKVYSDAISIATSATEIPFPTGLADESKIAEVLILNLGTEGVTDNIVYLTTDGGTSYPQKILPGHVAIWSPGSDYDETTNKLKAKASGTATTIQYWMFPMTETT